MKRDHWVQKARIENVEWCVPTAATKTPRKQIPLSQQKLIWMYSAGQCSFLGCPIRTERPETPEDPAVIIGEVAHIHAYEDDGPRALLTLTLSERNSYPNLMLMCPNHHTEIDKQPATFTAKILKKWKYDTEKRVTDALRNAMPQIDFAELQMITGSLITHEGSPGKDLTVIPPAEKLKKNQLSLITHAYLAIALAKADVVRNFIDVFTRYDNNFSAQLRSGFIKEYERLKLTEIAGDELFQEMLRFATLGRTDLRSQAAGLAILGYYFEACEVFEK
ncbi:MAG: hypothetical protein BGO25_00910 [Acidobacteriales bacterium 59-55]|nr:MAG: hypothetical protein BGO25_00910 [Acidobacteriales bacterium 59-55]